MPSAPFSERCALSKDFWSSLLMIFYWVCAIQMTIFLEKHFTWLCHVQIYILPKVIIWSILSSKWKRNPWTLRKWQYWIIKIIDFSVSNLSFKVRRPRTHHNCGVFWVQNPWSRNNNKTWAGNSLNFGVQDSMLAIQLIYH